jgi:AbrB family looped-hinge helix DNA binding protein
VSRVTSKLQVTIPKKIADLYGIRPGDELSWMAAGDAIRVIPETATSTDEERAACIESRLRVFDAATVRIARRGGTPGRDVDRGWSRAELYDRGRPR